MESKLAELERLVKEAQQALTLAIANLNAFKESPENNVFESLDEAEGVLEDRLADMAFEDCEGAGNCGLDEYIQEFIVDGKHYLAKLKCEYNRHDKTYYYLDGREFTVTPL